MRITCKCFKCRMSDNCEIWFHWLGMFTHQVITSHACVNKKWYCAFCAKEKGLDYKQDSVTEFPFYRCSSLAGEKACRW